MKFKLFHRLVLLTVSLFLIGCSSEIWYIAVPYQKAKTTQNQRMFKEKTSDTVLLVLVRDKYLNLKYRNCIYLLKSLEDDLLLDIKKYRKSRTEYGSYRYSKMKKDVSRIVGCPENREKILMHIPLNGKKERTIVLALSRGLSKSEEQSVIRKIFVLRKGEPQYYRWGGRISETHDYYFNRIDPNK